jgi:hypothetical protein
MDFLRCLHVALLEVYWDSIAQTITPDMKPYEKKDILSE